MPSKPRPFWMGSAPKEDLWSSLPWRTNQLSGQFYWQVYGLDENGQEYAAHSGRLEVCEPGKPLEYNDRISRDRKRFWLQWERLGSLFCTGPNSEQWREFAFQRDIEKTSDFPLYRLGGTFGAARFDNAWVIDRDAHGILFSMLTRRKGTDRDVLYVPAHALVSFGDETFRVSPVARPVPQTSPLRWKP